jgi:hypothetical protein
MRCHTQALIIDVADLSGAWRSLATLEEEVVLSLLAAPWKFQISDIANDIYHENKCHFVLPEGPEMPSEIFSFISFSHWPELTQPLSRRVASSHIYPPRLSLNGETCQLLDLSFSFMGFSSPPSPSISAHPKFDRGPLRDPGAAEVSPPRVVVSTEQLSTTE